MEELHSHIPDLRVVWNRNKAIPPTSKYELIITIETSTDIESIAEWLKNMFSQTLHSIATQTNAKETLINLITKKLEENGENN
jgi:hypothetical protein